MGKNMPLKWVEYQLENTVVGSIITCMLSGEFRDASDEPLARGKEPLGLMTSYERACFTVGEELCYAYNKIKQQLCLSDKDRSRCAILFNRSNRAFDLLESSIKERLIDFTHFRFHKDFQIVGTKKTSSSGEGSLKATYISGDGSKFLVLLPPDMCKG